MGKPNSILPADSTGTVAIVYGLYIVSVLFGLTAIAGIVMAYILRTGAPEWLATHYTYLIHTFWKGLAFMLLSAALSAVLIGYLILLAVIAWWIARCLKGIKLVRENQPVPDPKTWWI